jgi:hypothetical protein
MFLSRTIFSIALKEVAMAIINSVNERFHRIRVKLYPHYLPRIEGAYIARTANESSLSM